MAARFGFRSSVFWNRIDLVRLMKCANALIGGPLNIKIACRYDPIWLRTFNPSATLYSLRFRIPRPPGASSPTHVSFSRPCCEMLSLLRGSSFLSLAHNQKIRARQVSKVHSRRVHPRRVRLDQAVRRVRLEGQAGRVLAFVMMRACAATTSVVVRDAPSPAFVPKCMTAVSATMRASTSTSV